MKNTVQDRDINEIAIKVSAYTVSIVSLIVQRREDEALTEETRDGDYLH